MFLARVCERFHCTVSQAEYEWDTNGHRLVMVMEAWAVSDTKHAFEMAGDDPKRHPTGELARLVAEAEAEIAAEKLAAEAAEHGESV